MCSEGPCIFVVAKNEIRKNMIIKLVRFTCVADGPTATQHDTPTATRAVRIQYVYDFYRMRYGNGIWLKISSSNEARTDFRAWEID